MELTIEQSKAYLAELQDIELDDKELENAELDETALEKVAGGDTIDDCKSLSKQYF